MSVQAPIDEIDKLIAEKKLLVENLLADIGTLERAREILVSAFSSASPVKVPAPSQKGARSISTALLAAALQKKAPPLPIGRSRAAINPPSEPSAPAPESQPKEAEEDDDEPRKWHRVALSLFSDGETHTTNEILELAKSVVGADMAYSTVASWLNRMVDKKVFAKDGNGKFYNPSARRLTGGVPPPLEGRSA